MRKIFIGLLCIMMSACNLVSSPGVYTSKDLKCSFKIPPGFTIVTEEPGDVIFARNDNKFKIAVIRLDLKKQITDENINQMSGAIVATSLGIENLYDINQVVKLYGNRQVSGRKAAWYYYPDEKNGVLVYVVFLPGNGNSLYQIAFFITPEASSQYTDEVEQLVTLFLKDFKVKSSFF